MWRALRVVVDIGLHYKKMTREKALDLFSKYAWDTTDMVKKEITRYQGRLKRLSYGTNAVKTEHAFSVWTIQVGTFAMDKEFRGHKLKIMGNCFAFAGDV